MTIKYCAHCRCLLKPREKVCRRRCAGFSTTILANQGIIKRLSLKTYLIYTSVNMRERGLSEKTIKIRLLKFEKVFSKWLT